VQAHADVELQSAADGLKLLSSYFVTIAARGPTTLMDTGKSAAKLVRLRK
jgi:hypothetical protein